MSKMKKDFIIPTKLYRNKSRYQRMLEVLDYIKKLPCAKSGLEAYAQISNALNDFEDTIFGENYWSPPRTFQDGSRTDRLYPIMPENIFNLENYNGVTLLLAKKELLFISRFGAIEIQKKDESDKHGKNISFPSRTNMILFEKLDFFGDGVWHEKNM